jgi:hypothetical protein
MNETARTWFLLRIALAAAGLVVLFFSGVFPIENYVALVSPAQLTASVVPADVASLTNENRVENGLPALRVNPLLTQAAQLKADDMAQNSYYAHIGPDGKSPLYWLERVGYKYLNAGENLVIDRTTSEEAVSAWMNSADHRENILRPQFTEVGVGVAPGIYEGISTIFVVEEFGTPYPLSAPAVRSTVPAPVVNVQPLPETSIVSEVKALVTPVVHAIAPLTAPKPVPVVPATIIKTVAPTAHTTSTATHTIKTVQTPASTTPTDIPVPTSLTFALSPAFFTPTEIAHVHEPVAPGAVETVPATQNPTPSWLVSVKAYISRFANFVPRIW